MVKTREEVEQLLKTMGLEEEFPHDPSRLQALRRLIVLAIADWADVDPEAWEDGQLIGDELNDFAISFTDLI